MLKQLCKCVETAGMLRKQLAEIDFKKIYENKLEAAQAEYEMLKKLDSLTEITHDLIECIGRMK